MYNFGVWSLTRLTSYTRHRHHDVFIKSNTQKEKRCSAPQQFLSCTHILIGTVEQMIEELLRRRELYGMSSIVMAEAGIEAFAPLVGLGAPSDILEWPDV